MQRLIHQPRGKVRAAVISPTRELAEQTSVAFNDLGAYTGLRSTAIYGGVSMDRQLRALKMGVEIVVGCPGRLIDHLWGGTVDFSHLDVLVIDEADRMFDMGFLPGIRMVLECILERKQTLLFSATMPADIRRSGRRDPARPGHRPHRAPAAGGDGIARAVPGRGAPEGGSAEESAAHDRERLGARIHAHQVPRRGVWPSSCGGPVLPWPLSRAT